MGDISERSERERDWHNQRFANDPRSRARKFYLALGNWYADYHFLVSEWVLDGRCLELGAGLESVALRDGFSGSLCSIDISEAAVDKLAALNLGSNIKFEVADAHALPMDDESFDLIIGRGILHHLELPAALQEIKRVMKPSGAIIFGEPLAGNPVIRMYRLVTPKLRSSDEAPLTRSAIAELAKTLPGIQVRYYAFLTLLPAILGIAPPKLLEKCDGFLLNSCGLGQWLAWACLITKSPKT